MIGYCDLHTHSTFSDGSYTPAELVAAAEGLGLTAVALTDAQNEKLCAKLGSITGKTIDLINRVDPSCIGGVRLDYDGKRLDDTVSHRLDAVRGLLKNTVL